MSWTPEEFVRNYWDVTPGDAPAPNLPATQDNPGVLGHVLETLALFDRPRNALASGVYNLVDEDPATGFWSGAYKGISGERDVPWSDVFGWERTKPTDDWGTYLAKGGRNLAADVILDPLNLLFGAGGLTKGAAAAGKLGTAAQAVRKATGITALGEKYTIPALTKAGEAVRGTRIGKAFSMRGPDYIENLLMEAKRTGDLKPLEDLAKKTGDQLAEHLKARGITDPEQIAQAMNYDLPRAIETGQLTGHATQEMLDIIQPLQGMTRDIELERIAAKNRLADKFFTQRSTGLIPEESLPGGTYLPHLLSGKGRYEAAKLGRTQYNPSGMSEVHRQLRTFEDVGGNVYGVGRLDEIDKLERAGKLSTTVDESGKIRYWSEDGMEIFPRHSTLDEIENSGRYKGGWIRNPVAAYAKKAAQSNARTTYMRMMESLADARTPDGMRVLLSAQDDLPNNYRKLKLKGFEDYALPKVAANRLENVARLYDPDSVSGVLDKLVKDTRLGQVLESYTRWWKRNQLAPFPGYLVANAISDLSLAYMQGLTDPRLLEYGARIRGIGGKVGRGTDIMPGISNTELREAFRTRGLVDSGQFRILGEPGTEQAMREAAQVPFLEMLTGKAGKAGKPIQKAGKFWREKINDNFFAAGQWEQESVQSALAIDWLRKNVKKGARPTERQLNDAVRHAQDALFDYGDLPALQDTLRRIGAVPFIAWTSNIMRRFMLDAVKDPQRLARLGRFYDFTFKPINGADRHIMPEWMQEQAPVWNPLAKYGFGGPTTLLGRFLPHGAIEQVNERPGDAFFNMLGPLIKGPVETATNLSVYKDRPIDELSGGYLSGLVNPIKSALGSENAPYDLARQTTFPGVRLPATYEHAATTYLPTSRLLQSLGTLGAGAVFEDPNRMPMSIGAKTGWVITGGKTFEFDRDKAFAQSYRKYQRELGTIKSKFRYAQKKGDIAGQEHYLRLWQELRRNAPREAIAQNRQAQAVVEPGN